VTPEGAFPDAGAVPVVCDMSSDFLWRKFDVSRFGLAYAGAQKNVGPSGIVVVIVRKDLIAAAPAGVPKIFQYKVHADNNSLYNTPPTFSVYMIRNVLDWLKSAGGLAWMEAENRKKADHLYGAIDAHADFFRCPVERGSRSVMNVVFRLPSEALEERFVAEAKKQGMVGLKGHRSVGGIRVSTYNAVSLAWIDTLVSFMNEFVRTA
jgi:phosphoserine aminotransferase